MMRDKKQEKIDFAEAMKLGPKKRGRTKSLSKKPEVKSDVNAKLERSRQSAKECRARKKLRYQYLEEIISETEKSIFTLRKEMDVLKSFALEIDQGKLPTSLAEYRKACKHSPDPFEQLQKIKNEQLLLCSSPYGSLSPTPT